MQRRILHCAYQTGVFSLLLVLIMTPTMYSPPAAALSTKTYSFSTTHAKNYVTTGIVGFFGTNAATEWYAPNWTYRQKITIHKEYIGEELTDFPVLVRLNKSITDAARDDRFDLLFTSADGLTKLSYEREDSTTLWVKVPKLTTIEDTILYLYYGNPQVGKDQASPKDVWTNGYVGVWHLNNSPEGSIADSTKNNNTGAANVQMERGRTLQPGKVGQALEFNGTKNDYVDIAHSASLVTTSDVSVAAWIYQNNRADYDFIFAKESSAGWSGATPSLYINSNDVIRSTRGNASNVEEGVNSISSISAGAWYYVVATFEGTMGKIYMNGALDNTGSVSGTFIDSGTQFRIGGRITGHPMYFDGKIDDVRIHSAARSSAWVATEYKNQCDCEDFLTISSDPEKLTSLTSGQVTSDSAVATVQLKSGRPLLFSTLTGFTANAGQPSPEASAAKGGNLEFQLSNDAGKSWLFYYGGSPSTSSGHPAAAGWRGANPENPEHRSSANDINGHLNAFPVGEGRLLWKAYLPSGTSLDQIQVTYSSAKASSGGVAITSLSDSRIQAINTLFHQAFGRRPTESEWLQWASRLINGEKTTTEELLGAMQWQQQNAGRQVAGIRSTPITTTGPTIEIRNGTNRQGLGGRTLARLNTLGYHVSAVGNAQDFRRETSKVYVINHEEQKEGEELAETLKIPVGLDRPHGERATSADILVILGYDFGG